MIMDVEFSQMFPRILIPKNVIVGTALIVFVFAFAVELDLQGKTLGFYIDGEYKDIAFSGLPEGPVSAALSLYDRNASVIILNQVSTCFEVFGAFLSFCRFFHFCVALRVHRLHSTLQKWRKKFQRIGEHLKIDVYKENERLQFCKTVTDWDTGPVRTFVSQF